ncbi:MAG: alpha/beta fold hydrolase, partial [Anaerolineales bacterium]
VDDFPPPDITSLNIPVMIIESDNDPLLDETLRNKLKETYPTARVITLSDVGHFPYLNMASEYTRLLEGFLE